jgi:hypothetical protein
MHRHQLGLTGPLDEATVRRAMAAYSRRERPTL